MADIIAEMENKIESLKLELRHMKKEIEKINEEFLLFKGMNFEIN